MDEHLLVEVSSRLDADPELEPEVRRLIDAALLNEIDIDDGTVDRPAASPSAKDSRSSRVYVKAVKVAGFRGVGAAAQLDLPTGPGLTLVVGRNGSGKSSFAEGLELLLTGDNQRWSRRKSKEWKSGFRNIHESAGVFLEADLTIEGGPVAHARRSWKQDEALDAGTFTLTTRGQSVSSVGAMGWDQPLQAYRPFLSYSEIGSILDQGPSTLFDTLDPILGLADLRAAANHLTGQQKSIKDRAKEVRERLKEIRVGLAKLEDDRARRVDKLLAARKWKLDEIGSLITQDAQADDSSLSARLGHLARLPGPNLERVADVVVELREALKERETNRRAEGERTNRLLALLEKAIDFHQDAGDGDCPVCGKVGALHGGWAEQTKARVDVLRKEVEASASADRAIDKVVRRVRAMLSDPPPILLTEMEIGLDVSAAHSAWADWAMLKNVGPELLAEEIEGRALAHASALEELRRDAERARQKREQDWLAVALEIHAWLPAAQEVLNHADLGRQLVKAKKRLVDETQAIRDDRFAPIKSRVMAFWELLRARSSVKIKDLALTGSHTRRKVEIDVAVDGTKASALGVMSQGELNALVLSLFLPRATMAESPFGFLFIDDPVQAMDLARVDGLAQVLEEVARTHQVVVFTHDERLPAAIRRLKIESSVLAVERSRHSTVEITKRLDPVKQHLDDAWALAETDRLPPDVAARVVPGICRQALEAACVEVILRRRLAAGESHAEVERLLADNSKLNPLIALAMTDAPNLVEDARAKLNRRIHPRGAKIVKRCNRGAHSGWDDDLVAFVRDAQKLAFGIQGIS